MNDELILVTGASSYLGLHIVKTFLESNFKVRGTIRSFDKRLKAQALFSLDKAEDNLEVIEANLLDAESWTRVLENITIVIHCASPHPKKKPIDDDLLIQQAVEGTRNVLSAALSSKTVKKFILTSSYVSVSGYSLEAKKYGESDWADPERHVGYVKS
ncbi:unnamed protein product, partial [Brachionus calyciflorus]